MKSLVCTLIACLAGVATATGVAHAAGLDGGVSRLGADTSPVASCDTTGVRLGYTTGYDAAIGGYALTAVTLGEVDAACAGQTASVTVRDHADVELASGSVGVEGTTVTVPLTPSLPADAAIGTALVISR